MANDPNETDSRDVHQKISDCVSELKTSGLIEAAGLLKAHHGDVAALYVLDMICEGLRDGIVAKGGATTYELNRLREKAGITVSTMMAEQNTAVQKRGDA